MLEFMGPVNLSSMLSLYDWLFPTALTSVRGEKLGGPRITQPGWRWCQTHFFLGVVDLFNSIGNYVKGYHT
jgi:hypothetical protein